MNVEHFIAMNESTHAEVCEVTCQTPTNWQQVAAWLDANPGSSVTICKNCVDHPESIGMVKSAGWPVGQDADWRITFGDCRDLHVQDFGGTWHAHIDLYSPECGSIRHALVDLPKFSILMSVISGGVTGWFFGTPLIGAGLGAVEGVSAVLIANVTRPTRRPVCLKPGGCAP